LGSTRIPVNSLHGQGVNELGPGLTVEAVAEDGLVEAFSVSTAPGFTLAVQWHPEWRIAQNPYSMKMFGAFGDACRAYHQATKRNRL
jgi:putative glutamine amidotransferase